ncbi:TSUP family transporter [Marinicellulosiphila megalodicopiae]|uniref:TSUP family transporter n=1 Tax=Marinicellulosiphila megalodicopiae TaxID=2724896 RepID=UPI003BB1F742
MAIEILIVLFFVAMLAGMIDTLAGGGGLLTLPALMIAGLPPITAIATNKLQSVIGTGTSTLMMFKNKKVAFKDVKLLMLLSFFGSLMGAMLVLIINTDALEFLIPCILFLILIYFLFAPNLASLENKTTSQKQNRIYTYIAVPLIGMYDGVFGPGTGSFFSAATVGLAGKNLRSATAAAKTFNFSTNLAALLIFIIAGKTAWLVGIVMMGGQALGAWLGSHLLFKIDVKYLRALVVLMCALMLAKYIYGMIIN